MTPAIRISGPYFSTDEWRTFHDASTMLDRIADILIKHIHMATSHGYHLYSFAMEPGRWRYDDYLDCVLEFNTLKTTQPIQFGKLPFDDKPDMEPIWSAFKDKLLAAA